MSQLLSIHISHHIRDCVLTQLVEKNKFKKHTTHLLSLKYSAYLVPDQCNFKESFFSNRWFDNPMGYKRLECQRSQEYKSEHSVRPCFPHRMESGLQSLRDTHGSGESHPGVQNREEKRWHYRSSSSHDHVR